MATEVERLLVRLEADNRKFERAMARSQSDAATKTRAIERDFDNLNKRASSLMNSTATTVAAGFGRIAAAGAAYLSVGALKNYADGWQNAVNRIAAASGTIDGARARAGQVADIATRSNADFTATASLYADLSTATRDMGASQAQVLSVTETLAKAFAVGGKDASTQAGAIRQLGQALGSGKLSGDEFNSVAEGSQEIMDLLAKKLGVARGELKGLASDGKITSKVMVEALLEGSAIIEAKFATMVPTIEQSLNKVKTALTRYFGEIAADQNIAGGFASFTSGIVGNLDTVAKLAAVLGVALVGKFSLAAGAIGAAATALALFGDQVAPIAGDIATLGDYGRIAFEVIRVQGGEAAAWLSSVFREAADVIAAVLNGPVGDSLAGVAAVAKSVANAVIGAFAFAAETIRITWGQLGDAMRDLMLSAMNSVIALVEGALQKLVGGINTVLGAVSLPTISPPDLGRVQNDYAGAGAAAGRAYGEAFGLLTRDYVGSAVNDAAATLERVRARANEIGRDRARTGFRSSEAREYGRINPDGSLSAPLRDVGKNDEAGGGSSKKENEFQKELKNLEKRIVALNREREALGLTALEAAKAEAAHKMLDAAKEAGLPVTDALREKIGGLAEAYATVKVRLDEAKKSQESFRELQQFVGTSLSGFFSDIVSGGKNASDALMNLAKKLADAAFQAALLGQGPLAQLFGTAGAGGNVGGLIGSLFKLGGSAFGGTGAPLSLMGGFAAGGYTGSGPAGAPAGVVHGGEYVFSKASVDRIGLANLDALHTMAKGYAAGGYVGVPSLLASPRQAAGGMGGALSITVSASPELDARIASVSRGISVQVSRAAVAANNRAIPSMLAEREAR